MFEWLKAILGVNYTEEIDKQVAAEIGRGFVARGDFNTLSAENKLLREAQTELEGLKKDAGSIAELTAQLEEREKVHTSEIQKIKLGNALEAELSRAGARNKKAVMALLDTTKISLSEEGIAVGMTEQIEALKKAEGFLFEAPVMKGIRPAEGSDVAPKRPQDMSYTELCGYFKENTVN